MEVWEAIVLGLVQGLTEFLPVSSSGHLQIFNTLFGLQGEENLTFAVAVHAATVCSTIVVFRRELLQLIAGFFRFKWNSETIYISKILLSMIPVGIVGLFFKDSVEELFASGLLVVGCSLILTAILLAFAYYARPRLKENISFKDAFIIGVAQAFAAILPGPFTFGLHDRYRVTARRPERPGRPLFVPDGADSDSGRSDARPDERRLPPFRNRDFSACPDGGIRDRFSLRTVCLQLDDQYREEGQVDLFRCVLPDCRHRFDPVQRNLSSGIIRCFRTPENYNR